MRRCMIIMMGALLALFSCGSGDRHPKPFLEEPQMIDVLTDVYLLEAQLNVMKSEDNDVSELQRVYYDQLFEHYGITDSIFELNMAYYTRHPSTLERVMDSVTNRFLKMQ